MTKHVLVLNQYALPTTEAGGTRHAELFGRLRGWSFTVIAGDRNHYTQRRFAAATPEFALVPVPAKGDRQGSRAATWLAYCARAFGKALRSRKPDVVYASSPHLLTLLLGRALAALYRVPFVVEIRDLWPESIAAAGLLDRSSPLFYVLRAIERYAVRSADAIVAVTTGWEKHFAALGVDASKLTVVPNGSDPEAFQTPDGDRARLRRELDLDGFTAIFAGAHGPKDGIEHILEAAKSLPDVTFMLVGDGAVKPEARAKSEREGLGNVRFLDPVSKAELPHLLGACDVGIHSVSALPVFQLGMSPNKLFDYLAAGLPVVSNAGEPIQRLAADSPAVVVGAAGSLAESLRAVIDIPAAERQGLRADARRLVEDRFSRSRSAGMLESVLDRITADRATGRRMDGGG